MRVIRLLHHRALLWALGVLCACALAVAAVFRCHVQGTCTYTFDFITGYHPVNFFIVEHLRRGIWPLWIAPQSGGYPLHMQVQSDLYYITPWIFSALDLTYSLRAANIVQVIHVLFGGIGALFLAMRLGFLPVAGALSGVAYLLMGGFFDGSQHVDIIRGYAYYPWCLAALIVTPSIAIAGIAWRVAVLSLFFLGAYPGEVIASFFIWSLFVLVQLWMLRASVSPRRLACIAILWASLGGMALSIAIPKYQPFFAEFAQEVTRSGDFAKVARARFTLDSIFSFSLNCSSGTWTAQSTLRSHYVGLVILALALMSLSVRTFAKRLFVAVLAAALVLSADLPLKLLGPLGKPFALSRMTLADYKGYITLAVIILAAANFDALLRGTATVSRTRALVVGLALITYQAMGLWFTSSPMAAHDAVSVCAMAIFLVGALIRWGAIERTDTAQVSARRSAVFASVVCLLVAAEGIWVQSANTLWRDAHVIQVARKLVGFDIMNGRPEKSRVFESVHQRPARKDVGHTHSFTSRGFYTGQFILKGYDASKNLRKHEFLSAGPNLHRIKVPDGLISFFSLPGCALTFPSGTTPTSVAEFFRSATPELLALRCRESPIQPRRYEATRVAYDVKLPEDMLVVENEISWAGWSGVLAKTGRATRYPLGEFSPYRTWLLPKGRYRFVESFENTHLAFSFQLAGICLAFFTLSTFLVAWRLRRGPSARNQGVLQVSSHEEFGACCGGR